jgi:hypothetical protein
MAFITEGDSVDVKEHSINEEQGLVEAFSGSSKPTGERY